MKLSDLFSQYDTVILRDKITWQVVEQIWIDKNSWIKYINKYIKKHNLPDCTTTRINYENLEYYLSSVRNEMPVEPEIETFSEKDIEKLTKSIWLKRAFKILIREIKNIFK